MASFLSKTILLIMMLKPKCNLKKRNLQENKQKTTLKTKIKKDQESQQKLLSK